jgi:hypothetical protein
MRSLAARVDGYHGPPRSFAERMIGAARLRSDVFEEVEADTDATRSAALVVIIVSLASAAGGASGGAGAALAGLVGALLGWLIWSGVTYLIGDKLLGGTATWGELLRTIGFAQAPGVLGIFRVIPGLDPALRIVISLWILAAVIIAIRQALDFGTGRAILTAMLGFIAYVALGFMAAAAALFL